MFGRGRGGGKGGGVGEGGGGRMGGRVPLLVGIFYSIRVVGSLGQICNQLSHLSGHLLSSICRLIDGIGTCPSRTHQPGRESLVGQGGGVGGGGGSEGSRASRGGGGRW